MKANELLQSIAKVRRKEVGKPSLDPQLEELSHSVDNDPIFKAIVKNKRLPSSIFSFAKVESVEKLTTSAQMLIDLVASDYQACCEAELVKLCSTEGSKIEIILVTKLYIAHIINRGYSAEFIYDCVRGTFYQDRIARCTAGLLGKLFSCFPDRLSRFDLFYCCGAEYARFLEDQLDIKKYLSVNDIKPATRSRIPENFGEGGRKRVVVVPGVPGKDAFSAARNANMLFSLSRSFLYLHPENVKPHIDGIAYAVHGKSKEVTRLTLDQGFVPRRASRNRSDNANSISGLRSYVFPEPKSLRRANEGQHRIFSSLNSASLAAKTSDPESRLLSIWSAFEALLPDPMRDGEGVVRILHFADLITPCAVFDYLPSTFAECYRNCSTEFGDSFINTVTELGTGATEVEKFASVFIADQGTKQTVCATVSSSPLMLMRFHRLEKLLSDPKNACRYLDTHERRVVWQIHRIYRERNGIVHKAKSNIFLDGLIENSYAYYRSVILHLERVHTEYKVTHPDQGLEMIRSLYSEYKLKLQQISEAPKGNTADKKVEFTKFMFAGSLRA
ncbi:MAG TPA: hypothetical protein DCY03_08905 [Planctomycetaceae bacterium]|nr:hypothetical protein [Planctomycetaceae bacterium]|tara:strand:+ start:320 stop:1996 length:1677 start_codon:yes stop_codon:yes gene_type:complete